MVTRSRRSSSYPSYSIEFCISLVRKIYENFGSGNYYARREDISKTLGLSESFLQTQVSSASQYNLLDLKSGEGYKPSKLFIKIHKPVNSEQKHIALIEAFQSPTLYASLIKRYENETLPSLISLSNILLQHFGIADKVSEKAAKIFLANAKYVNALTTDNVLMLTPNIDKPSTDKIGIIEQEEIVPIKSVINSSSSVSATIAENNIDKMETIELQQNNVSSGNFVPFNILLKGKRRAQLMIPDNIESSDFDTIINWIRLMKESF